MNSTENGETSLPEPEPKKRFEAIRRHRDANVQLEDFLNQLDKTQRVVSVMPYGIMHFLIVIENLDL